MTLRRPASFLVLFSVVIAPFVAGTNVRFAGAVWWVAGPLFAAFALVLAERARSREGLGLPAVAWSSAGFLLACVGWWLTRPDRPFATDFARSHWEFLTTTSGSAILGWSRREVLVAALAAWGGFFAVASLARDAVFRGRLLGAVGLTGVAIAGLSVAQRAGVLPLFPWVVPGDRAEAFNVTFFHYSGPAVAANLAWPLLVFSGATTAWRRLAGGLALGVVAAAAVTWESAAAQVIAVGLLVTGAGLAWARRKRLPGGLMVGGVAAVFVAIAVWQTAAVLRQEERDPDRWEGVEATRAEAADRGAAFAQAADRRGDRLAMLSSGDRSAVWQAGVRMAADHPLLGHGPGSWARDFSLYSNNSMVNTFIHYVQFAHNDLLQVAAEWGGLAALAWLVLWSGALKRTLAETLRSTPDAAGAGLFLALLGAALHSTVDFPLQYPGLMIWCVLLLGVAWASRPGAAARG